MLRRKSEEYLVDMMWRSLSFILPYLRFRLIDARGQAAFNDWLHGG